MKTLPILKGKIFRFFAQISNCQSGNAVSSLVASFVYLPPMVKHVFKFKMDKVINLGIPHISELIFESIDTPELFQCALVSETWKILAESDLIKRWKGKMLEA